MKGSQKRWQLNNTDSVIATLMGFDQPPTQQPVHDRRRVLSESYMHNVASISLRPGSSVTIKGVSGVRRSNVLDECVDSSSSNVRSSARSLESSVSSSLSQKTEHFAARRILRRHQILEHDFEDVKFDTHSRPEYRELGKSLMPEFGKPNHEFTCKELVVNGHSFFVSIGSMGQISPPERRRSKFEHVLKADCKVYGHDPHSLLDQSSLANKSSKKYFERRKKAKKVKKFGVSEIPRNLESKSGRASLQLQTSLGVDNTIPPNSNVSELPKSDVFSSGSSHNSAEACVQGIPDELDTRFENDDSCKEIEPSLRNPKSSISNLPAQYTYDASYDSEDAVNAQDFTRINGDPLSKSYPGILLEEDVHSSDIEEVVSREASLNELSEEESASPKCSRIGPLENLNRTSQHSPVSVLESHDTNNPSPFKRFDSIGLMLQLQALNFDLEESLSEGSAIVVSGDEDIGELFGDLSNDRRKIKRWLGDEESGNFSYLVDVLDEAGLYDTNLFVDFNKWDSLECPISPLVFDALEKKYGKQTSWQKSERRLLFDRINSGLLGIYYPVINFHDGAISFRKKLCSSFRRDEVENELWAMLISQENEKSKHLSALDKWWEFNEGVSIICGELEASLFDELVMELASS